ncbi:MAG: lipoprotein-releasing ABC transporter permease subunit [Gammaproteobacteria bacterium]|nr:lipoprotein-releasing ABC transporter permease subunit [Gammaproteobacteria bacterium]
MSERQRWPAWSLWIGARYLRARRANRFVGFISAIAMAGILLGVAVLIAVLSVMNGFETELRSRILDVVAHATLEGQNGRLDDWRRIRELTGGRPEVIAVAPYAAGWGMLVSGTRSAAVELRGVEPGAERTVSRLHEHLRGAALEELQPGRYRLLLGRRLAGELQVASGDRVLLVVAQGQVTPAGLLQRMRSFTVAGLIDSGMFEYDRGLALLHLDDAARLLRLGDAVSGLRYRLTEPLRAARVVRALALEAAWALERDFLVSDWTRRHGNFFRSIQVTKSILFVVLLLLIAVAAFNIIATLVMVVKDKRGDIAILRAQGASPREILAVFLLQGTAIGALGTLAGVALGLAIAANITAVVHGLERLLGVTLVDPGVYLIADLPAEVRAADVALVGGTALVLAIAATIWPALRAAATQPAEALRHEV